MKKLYMHLYRRADGSLFSETTAAPYHDALRDIAEELEGSSPYWGHRNEVTYEATIEIQDSGRNVTVTNTFDILPAIEEYRAEQVQAAHSDEIERRMARYRVAGV